MLRVQIHLPSGCKLQRFIKELKIFLKKVKKFVFDKGFLYAIISFAVHDWELA